jgi:hypothetical protein
MKCHPKGIRLMLAALTLGLLLAAFGAPATAGPIVQAYELFSSRGARIVSAPAGSSLVILGYNLGSSGTVTFRGVPATNTSGLPAASVVSWTREEILVTVPTPPYYPFVGAVTVTTNAGTGYGPEFTITAPSPSEPPSPPQPPAPPTSPPPPSTIGTWSVISLPQKPGEVLYLTALTVDTAGNLYVAEWWASDGGQILKRDVQGTWSVIATSGIAPGQVDFPLALAVGTDGTLYVADHRGIQKRNVQGNWSVIAAAGTAIGQVEDPRALAVDAVGNLYVADSYWDAVTAKYRGRIEKRDALGNWSVIAPHGPDLGQVGSPTALAVDTDGNLYIADHADYSGRIQKRDAQGNWSVIATNGRDVGQIYHRETLPTAPLAVDGANNLYVADTGNQRVQKFTPSR